MLFGEEKTNFGARNQESEENLKNIVKLRYPKETGFVKEKQIKTLEEIMYPDFDGISWNFMKIQIS